MGRDLLPEINCLGCTGSLSHPERLLSQWCRAGRPASLDGPAIRPMQQIAGHFVGSRPILYGILAVIDEEIKALKWTLWHGQLDRAICALEKIIVDMDRAALVDYRARHRAGRRISTSLAESAVNSLVAKWAPRRLPAQGRRRRLGEKKQRRSQGFRGRHSRLAVDALIYQ